MKLQDMFGARVIAQMQGMITPSPEGGFPECCGEELFICSYSFTCYEGFYCDNFGCGGIASGDYSCGGGGFDCGDFECEWAFGCTKHGCLYDYCSH